MKKLICTFLVILMIVPVASSPCLADQVYSPKEFPGGGVYIYTDDRDNKKNDGGKYILFLYAVGAALLFYYFRDEFKQIYKSGKEVIEGFLLPFEYIGAFADIMKKHWKKFSSTPPQSIGSSEDDIVLKDSDAAKGWSKTYKAKIVMWSLAIFGVKKIGLTSFVYNIFAWLVSFFVARKLPVKSGNLIYKQVTEVYSL